MIKFFRQIRFNLLSENKTKPNDPVGRTSKYLKYAIGEIILVVIGILIALQVNNWNENKKVEKIEQVILLSLKDNIADNLNQLDEAHRSVVDTYHASLKLLSYIQPEDHLYPTQEVDSLISTMFTFTSFEPASGAIQEIINSGQLNILDNKELRIEISKWSQIIEDTQEDIKITNDYLFHEVIVYLCENAQISNKIVVPDIASRINISVLPESNFNENYSKIMRSPIFENMVRWNTINLAYILNEFVEFRNYLENILNLIDVEIKPGS